MLKRLCFHPKAPETSYDAIVVGGGVAGCMLAGKLAMNNQHTLLVEAGPQVLDRGHAKRSWQTNMPAASFVHRAKGDYIRKIPIPDFRSIFGKVPLETTGALEIPRVLGGSGVVLGGLSYFRGHKGDWMDAPIEWREMQRLYKRLESVSSEVKHRGRKGRFIQTTAEFVTKSHKVVLESFQKNGIRLISNFNGADPLKGDGMGRLESLINPNDGTSGTTLSSYLYEALFFQRPLDIVTEAEVAQVFFQESNGNAQAIQLKTKNGEMQTVHSHLISLCAGTIGTAEVLNRSVLPSNTPKTVGKTFWATPSITIQCPLQAENFSLNAASSPIVQAMSWFSWLFLKSGWGLSRFDDMVALLSFGAQAKSSQYPNIRINVQPFMLEPDGCISSEDGIQFEISLARPSSQGQIQGDTIVPGYFTTEEDVQVMNEAIEFVHESIETLKPLYVRKDTTLKRYFSGTSSIGGSCSLDKHVYPRTMRLRGTNLVICDGSLIGRPILADTVPLVMALAERCGDLIVQRSPPIRNP